MDVPEAIIVKRNIRRVVKSILATGGAGYIGSHTAKLLHQQGYQPVVFDNLRMGHEWAVKWGPFIKGDLYDKECVSKALVDYQIDAVIHFAASAYVGESVENPRKYFRNNVANSMNLLEAMDDAGVRNIVFSSTCALYGNPEKLPLDEKHKKEPINPYGDTKLMVEKMLKWYGEAFGLNWIALRYFNASGADPDNEIGEDHDPETHLIPLIIYAATGKIKQLKVFGTDYNTPDGTAIRDYIHVNDLAQAHLAALKKLGNGMGCKIFNLGTGKGNSVMEVIQSVEKITGLKVPFEAAPRRAGDPPELVADSCLAQRELGWRPNFQELDDIVKSAWDWHQTHFS